jgi:DNA-binding NarL/FixJ family response regulator
MRTDIRQRGQGPLMPRERSAEISGTVLIADDHEIFRFGLAQLLRASMGVKNVIEADSFEEALRQLDDPDLTLAIFDLGMPGITGPHDLLLVRRRRPEVRVVVLTASEARQDILSALEAGVHGFMIKSERTEVLIGRLRYVASGEIYVPPILAETLAPADADPAGYDGEAGEFTLSDRQRDVLKGLVKGLSNKEIARELGLSEGTVKMHIAALFRALKATNRAHAAALGKHLLG